MVFAIVHSAACDPSSDLWADELSSELIGQLRPLALWKLDGDGRVLFDETERFVGLSQGGVSFDRRGAIPGDGNGAVAFDGQSGCIVVQHHDKFLLDRGTVACWVKADDVARKQGVLSKDANGFGEGGHLTISIDQGQIVVRLQSRTDSYEVHGAIGKHRWAHVAFTFGGEGMRLFVDGKLVDSHAYAGGLGATSGGTGNREPLVFGASTMTSQAGSELPLDSFFKGTLDDVAAFSRQLAASEIAELANAATPRYRSLVRAYVANQPKAWWRLDESASSLVAFDQAGRQHGTYHVVGSSHFDGDDYVAVAALDLDNTSFTILAEIQPKSFAVSDARIIAKENGLNEEDQFWSLSTTIRDDDPRLRFRLKTDNGTREAVSSGRNLQVNERVFVAAVYDGRTMRLYQDGELVGEVAQRGRPKTNAHCHVWIGDSPAGAGKRPFDGMIRDVAILEDAISPDRIRAIFDASRERPAGETLNLRPLASEPAAPFVHRCPLCDFEYHQIPIYRVPLPTTHFPPCCETPFGK